MPTTRALSNGSRVVDWTEEVNSIPNQYGMFNGMGLFTGKGVSTESIIFDKNTSTTTMIPQTNRRQGDGFKNKERSLETFSIALPYFKHVDAIFPGDVQGWRQGGTPDQAEDLPNVRMEKFDDMRRNADQTREYMKISAVKGVTVDPEGNTIVDAFTEFGVSQKEVDFALGTAATNIDAKIAEVKRYVAKNAKQGGAIGKIEVPCSPEFFDALTTHSKMVAAYNQYQNSGKQLNRDDLSMYEKWGVVDKFEHKGILFWSYDAVFNQPDGTEVRAFGTDSTSITKQVGYSIVKGMPGLYRGFFGPANTLSGANKPGTEFFLHEYRDPKDRFLELELEMSPLYFLTVPLVSVKCSTTT
jgi:hypothetical protein